MKLDDLNKKLREISIEHSRKKNSAISEYCLANNSVNVGDVFTDHIGPIRVEAISYHISDKPCCVYIGPELKKNLEPKKIRSVRSAWQSNKV
jgi:hypothetical protein